MSKVIVDASFVLAYLIPDEKREEVDLMIRKFKEGTKELISTILLPFEVLNALKMAFKRGRISKKLTYKLANEFLKMKISLFDIDYSDVLDISIKRNLTFYDASYLELSLKLDHKLLTLDKDLQKFSTK